VKHQPNYLVLATILAAGLITPAVVPAAFAHPHLVLTPDESDHEQMNANPIVLTLGHSNEPAFGAKPGIHDGKHDLELFIEDAATTMPLAGANLTLDRYYFADISAFENASSVEDATEVDMGIPLRGVFGETGVYSFRQIVKEGIYGYRVYGTVDYFGAARIPVDSTVFCTTNAGNTTKFNSPGWEGSYGCIENVESLLFPEDNDEVSQMISSGYKAQTQQTSLANPEDTAKIAGTDMTLALSGIIPAVGVATFLGMRRYKKRDP
jgi:hypothetical protein